MTEYATRFYRSFHDSSNTVFFHIAEKESDLWIGIDRESAAPSLYQKAADLLREARREVQRAIDTEPLFLSSLKPLEEHPLFPSAMTQAALKAKTGPMAAVAGYIAEYVLRGLLSEKPFKKVIVENGGDICVWAEESVHIGVFAGTSPLSGRLGLNLPCRGESYGICTSSGTVGHSLSFGKADAVVIICRDSALADAYATSFANRIRSKEDLAAVIEDVRSHNDIDGGLFIMGEDLAVTGSCPLYVRKEGA